MRPFARLRDKIRAINERFSHPHMEMSPMVRRSLLALRIYLFVLVGLMVYKFVTLLA